MVYAGINGLRILRRHLPKRIFDDAWRVVASAKLQKKNVQVLVSAEKFRIPLSSSVPALILHEGVVAAQVHGHGLTADRTAGNELAGHAHVGLLLEHTQNDFFIVVGLLAARLCALEQAIIALRVEQTVFVEARALKLVIDIRGDDEIILVL